MASAIGMAKRTQAANQRIDGHLSDIADLLDLPTTPERARDPFYDEVLRLEWFATVIEALAAFKGLQGATA